MTISKLPVRQRTFHKFTETTEKFSKLPVRQRTIDKVSFFCMCLSKLPVRQRTGQGKTAGGN